jgi:hydroxyacylglutathione hydrolase
VLDVRPFDVFATGHLPGAVNVPVSGHSFAIKAGFVLVTSSPAVVHASSVEEAARAVRGLRSVGFLELAGTLVDPVGGSTVTLAPVRLDEVDALLADGSAELVDVREESEREESPLPGSRHVPYGLAGGLADGLPSDHMLITVCESGPRAAVAASVLAAHGLDARPLVDAGVSDLRAQRAAPEVLDIRHQDVTHA